MSVVLIHVTQSVGPFVVTQRERMQAATFCAMRGPAWAAVERPAPPL